MTNHSIWSFQIIIIWKTKSEIICWLWWPTKSCKNKRCINVVKCYNTGSKYSFWLKLSLIRKEKPRKKAIWLGHCFMLCSSICRTHVVLTLNRQTYIFWNIDGNLYQIAPVKVWLARPAYMYVAKVLIIQSWQLIISRTGCWLMQKRVDRSYKFVVICVLLSYHYQ